MLKLALTAFVLAAAPMTAMAACSTHQAMSCADGMVWDDESKTCTKQVSS